MFLLVSENESGDLDEWYMIEAQADLIMHEGISINHALLGDLHFYTDVSLLLR